MTRKTFDHMLRAAKERGAGHDRKLCWCSGLLIKANTGLAVKSLFRGRWHYCGRLWWNDGPAWINYYHGERALNTFEEKARMSLLPKISDL